MNASQKSVILARGVYFRALYQNLATDDQTPEAEVIRAQWRRWADEYQQLHDEVCRIQNDIFEWCLDH
jgi:hypothetical protein